jgi:lipoyl(octanoyl) transferase
VQVRKLDTIGYEQALEVQRELHEQRVAGEIEDTLLLLEHPSVYTAGRRTLPEERPFDGTPVLDVDRGGKITWHGPGQLVGYPIVALPDPIDVVAYVRRLETALIAACAELGLPAGIVEGRSGVWTPDGRRKLAAIGIRVSRGVTMHGFAINCDPDLRAYDRIIACGIRDASVTSLSVESGKHISVADAVEVVERCVVAELGRLAAGLESAEVIPA